MNEITDAIWVPLVSIIIIVIALLLSIIDKRIDHRDELLDKTRLCYSVFRIIACSLWIISSISAEWFIYCWASSELIDAPLGMFIALATCICLIGIIATWKIFHPQKPSISKDNSSDKQAEQDSHRHEETNNIKCADDDFEIQGQKTGSTLLNDTESFSIVVDYDDEIIDADEYNNADVDENDEDDIEDNDNSEIMAELLNADDTALLSQESDRSSIESEDMSEEIRYDGLESDPIDEAIEDDDADIMIVPPDRNDDSVENDSYSSDDNNDNGTDSKNDSTDKNDDNKNERKSGLVSIIKEAYDESNKIGFIAYRKRFGADESQKDNTHNERTLLRQIVFISSRSIIGIVVAFISVLMAAAMGTAALEIAYNPSLTNIPVENLEYEYSIILAAISVLYLVFQRKGAVLCISVFICSLIGIAEGFVESFKHSAILPSDVTGVMTAADVASGYEYVLTTGMILSLMIVAVSAIIFINIKDPLIYLRRNIARGKSVSVRIIFASALCIISIISGIIIGQTSYNSLIAADDPTDDLNIEMNYWESHTTYHESGFIPSFITACKELELQQPEGYSEDKADELIESMSDAYDEANNADANKLAAAAQFNDVKPNVVVVMDETFADLSNMNGLNVGYTGPEFYKSWNDGVISKGELSVSAYGGGTCNTEFEFLTGISIGSLNAGTIPYTMYNLSDIYSIPKQMSDLGYTTTAIHPEPATNWNRAMIYPELGFDEFIDGTSFENVPENEKVRGHVGDKATYDKVLEQLRDDDRNGGSFIWDLTMANHSPYNTGAISNDENIDGLELENVVDPEAAQQTREYLSSVAVSDADLEYLIDELSEFDEPTVLIYFGDHQPGFSWWYTDVICDDPDGLEATEMRQQTVYGIWSNYSIDGNDYTDGYSTETIGASQLAAYAFERIGVPLTSRQKANLVARASLTSLNAYGWMDSAGTWHDISESPLNGWYESYRDSLLKQPSEEYAYAESGLESMQDDSTANSEEHKRSYNGTLDESYDETEQGHADIDSLDALTALRWIAYKLFA